MKLRMLLLAIGLAVGLIAVAAVRGALAQTPSAAESALATQAQNAASAKQWAKAAELFQKLTAEYPHWQYYQGLGISLGNLGRYEEALGALEKGIALARQDKSDPARAKNAIGAMLIDEGNIDLKLSRTDAARAAYTQAAAESDNPAVAYMNLCAVDYNGGNADAAVANCNRAIAANPNLADAYFVKGSLLVADSKLVGNKLVAPPAAREALEKYLDLAPTGPHAGDARQMLDMIK